MTLQYRALRGSMAGSAAVAVNLTLTVAQVPLLLYFWDSTTYGLWLTLLSLLSLLSVFDLGHNDYVGALFNRYYVENTDNLRRCLASALCMALMLAAIELLVGSLAVLLIPVTFFLGQSAAPLAGELRSAALVYLVYWALFGSVVGVFTRLYNPKGFYARATNIAIVMRLSQFAALIGSAMLSPSLLHAMVFYCGAGGVVSIVVLFDVRHKFSDLLPRWSDVSVPTGLKNFSMSLWLTVCNFIDQASSNGLTVLVARLLGADAVPVLATLRTVASVVTQGASVMVTPLAPEFARYYHRREPLKLTAALGTAWAIGGTIANLAILFLILIAPTLYAWWTHGHIAFDPVLFRYLCLAVCVRCSVSGSLLFLSSINQLQSQLTISAARGFTAVLVFCTTFSWLGVPSAGLALLLSEVVACLGVMTWCTRSEIQKLGGDFPWLTLTLNIVSLGVVAAVFWLTKPGFVMVGAGLVAILFLGWQQFKHLQAAVQDCLLSLAREFVSRRV